MAKTYQQIEEEANRLFGKGPSTKKFDWRREQQRAAGLQTESKKRGGVAGMYDRNKKLVSGAATGVGYLLGGSAGAAGTRALIQGLDRPGKAGIGIDYGRALKGGLEGYAAGKGVDVARSLAAKAAPKLGEIFGAKSAPPAATPAPGGEEMIPKSAIPGGGGDTAPAKKNLLSSILGFARENPAIIAGAASGLSGVIGDRYQAEAAQRRLDLDEEMYRQEQERKNRLAQLLMPFFRQQLEQYSPQQQG